MANYAVTTKVILHNGPDDGADNVSGSYANRVSTYIETLDSSTESVISIHSVPLVSSNLIMTIIVHNG